MLRFREAQLEDIPALHRVRLSVKENALSHPARVTPAMYVQYLSQDGRGWLCECDEQVLGFSILNLNKNSVWALFVDPAHEQRGIGKQLLTLLVQWAKAQGITNIKLSTGVDTRAERFYQKQGWRPLGLTEDGERLFEISLT